MTTTPVFAPAADDAEQMTIARKFASGVVHKLNNILTIIQGHANLLLSGDDLPSEMELSLRQIRQAAERAAVLSHRLELFSLNRRFNFTRLDLNEMIESLAPWLRSWLAPTASLEFELAPEAALVFGDRDTLEQVVLNLASNAQEAVTAEGHLWIKTRIAAPAGRGSGIDDRKFVVLTFADDGTGMTPEQKQRLFEPFFSTKRNRSDAGLGLLTVHAIVQRHGGFVQIESARGAGTVVEVWLPVEPPPPAAAASF